MSCGARPMEENGKNLLRAPIFDGPSMHTCEISSQPSPSSTFAPTTKYGAIWQDDGIFAERSTIGVGWTFIHELMLRFSAGAKTCRSETVRSKAFNLKDSEEMPQSSPREA